MRDVVGGRSRPSQFKGRHSTSAPIAERYSTTNVQVMGVDEADFVKNDAAHLYVVADGVLRIIAAWPPEEARIVATVDIAGEPQRLYVHGDRALIYTSLEPLAGYEDLLAGYELPAPYTRAQPRECTDGYRCEFDGNRRALLLTLLDITDREAPELLREFEINGSYLSSRRIGDIVHTVVTFPQAVPVCRGSNCR